MKQIAHIGIAVNNLDEAIERYTVLLNTPCCKKEVVTHQQVEVAFFQLNNHKIELLAATSPESPIARFLQKKGEGMHHVAYSVENIKQEMERLIKEGFTPLQENPYPGADNKWVAFFHPNSTHGVLTELCMDMDNER